MTRALVLGGGGPVGIGWQAGLLQGLADRGIDVAAADSVIGTSAGSAVGLTLASGRDLSEAPDLVTTLAPASAVGAAPAAVAMQELLGTVASAASAPGSAEALRIGIGRLATSAQTIGEDKWLAAFDTFSGMAWPDAFSCTAVDVDSGRFQVWDRDSGVDPRDAVASSCAVPAIYPPVTIGGARYMDGGVRDSLNADLAAGHDVVVAVSCILLELPEGVSVPVLETLLSGVRAHLDGLRAAGATVTAVVPGPAMLEVSGWGLELMDFTRADAAYRAGLAQAEEEAGRVRAVWGG